MGKRYENEPPLGLADISTPELLRWTRNCLRYLETEKGTEAEAGRHQQIAVLRRELERRGVNELTNL